MTVITLSRELGSGGDDVAVAVAERLGLRLVGREIINRAAADAGAGEVALAELDELGLLGVKPSAASLKRYREKVIEILEAYAREGDVLIVGRGGQVVLAKCAGVLHVRITAPRQLRLALVQARYKVAEDVSAAHIEASDTTRASYHKRHFDVRWEDEALYDLVLNMARLTASVATDIICAGADALQLNRLEMAAED